MTAGPTVPRRALLSRRQRLLVYWLAGLLIAYTLFGFFAIPLIIRKVIVPQVQKRLHATISLERAYTNPFSFWISLHNLQVQDLGGERVLAFDRFDANFQPVASIFTQGWHFDTIRVVNPFSKGRIEADGSNTLASLVKAVPPDPAAKPREPLKRLPRFVIRDLSIEGGSLDFKDLSTPKPFERVVHGASLHITNVDTHPDNVNPMLIEFATDDGATFTWTGTLQLNPLTSSGEIRAEGIIASRWMPYAMRYTDITLEGASVSASLTYEFAPAANPRVATAHIRSAAIEVPKVVVPRQEFLKGRAHASAQRVVVTDIQLDAVAQHISIEKFLVQGGDSLLELSEGRTVPQRVADALLSQGRTEPHRPAKQPAPAQDLSVIPYPIVRLLTGLDQLLNDVQNPWSIRLESIDVEGHSHAFMDLSAPEAVQLSASNVALHTGPITSAERFKAPFTLAVDIEPSGRVEVSGTIEPLARRIDVTIEGQGLNAAEAAPYIPAAALAPLPPARLGDSVLSLSGAFHAELPVQGGARTGWKGRTVVAPLTFESSEQQELVLGAQSLDIESDATLNSTPTADIDIAWTGTVKGAGFSAAAPIVQTGETRADINALGLRGTFGLNRSSDGAVSITYEGSADLGMLKVSATEPFGPVSAAISGCIFQGELEITAPPASAPHLLLRGNVSGSGIASAAEKYGHAALASATVDALDLRSAQKSIAASLVSLRDVELKLSAPILPPEGFSKGPSGDNDTISLAGLLPFDVSFDRFELTGGMIELTDTSVTPTSPPTVIAAEDIAVTAAPLSTSGGTASDITATARVNQSGRIALAGTLDAFNDSPRADLRLDLSTIPLPPYSSLTGRFLGYQIASGRMTAFIPMQIADNQVRGEIDFAFDRLRLGERVASKDAIDAPLELGLALLRDSNDQIKSNIPFSGDLTDPKFSLSTVIWQAFTGLLVKAATAPFQILGAIFGGGDTDLSQIAFAPGSAELTPASISALDVLAKGLKERPGLRLRIRAQYEQVSDSYELRRQIVREGYAVSVLGQDQPASGLSEAQFREQTMIAFDNLRIEQARARGEQPPPSVRRVGSDFPAPPPLQEMENALIEATALPDQRVVDLLRRRADAVATFLIKEKQIDPERVQAAELDPVKRDADRPRAAFEMY